MIIYVKFSDLNTVQIPVSSLRQAERALQYGDRWGELARATAKRLRKRGRMWGFVVLGAHVEDSC